MARFQSFVMHGLFRSLLALSLLLAAWPTMAQEPAALVCEQVTLYSRQGCPHCRDAKLFLAELQQRFPQLTVTERDIEQDPGALQDFLSLNEERHIRAPGVPMFDFCGEVMVGFSSPKTSGVMLESVLTGRQDSIRDNLAARVPVFGDLSPSALGLPVFTVLIGLVDGFNPCAMWVLLFLLSMLVHVKGRGRILMVASTFVLVSGAVYYAFMAAWFNAFQVLGYSRGLQLLLGVMALVIGSIHVKDFFLLKQGVSLSIPEGVKPTLYEKMRNVVRAENVGAALVGVTVIAVLVNFVELLCTAGLPALYTQVLTYYPLSSAGYYGYLGLYILAYIADDALMVSIAVITLGNHKLQEREGRWLKLISGGAISVLGILLLVAPDLLVF
jgi:glutaredoxin